MPDASNHTFTVGGHRFEVAPMGGDDQFEIECIMFRTFGTAAGSALRTVAAGIIPMFIDLLADMAGKGERFDLENILHYVRAFVMSEDGTRDPRMKQVWDDFLGVLADTGAETLEVAVSSLALRVDVASVRRVFDLVLFKNQRTFYLGTANTSQKPATVSNMETLDRLFDRRPLAKWEMLSQGIRATYLRDGADEDEGAEQGDA